MSRLSKLKRWLCMHKNLFRVCSTGDEICSAYAQQGMKSFSHMLRYAQPAHAITFESTPKNQIKKQFSSINNRNLEKSRIPSYWTILNILQQKFLNNLNKKLVPRMLSHCKNVRTSNFQEISKEKNKKKLKIDQGHIRFCFRQKQFIIISSLCTFKISFKSVNVISMGGSQKEVGLTMLLGIMLAKSQLESCDSKCF